MGSTTLYDFLPILKNAEEGRRLQFEEYFKTAPLWLLEGFQVEKMDAATVFVKEDDPVELVYFIVKGMIEAIDYRFLGVEYEFMRLNKLYAIGGMEVIMELPRYKTTLRTASRCTMLKLPSKLFSKWLATDIRALKSEAKLTGEVLLEESRQNRAMLFLQGADRLAMLLVQRYEHYAKNGLLVIKSSRQDLSNVVGLSVKTINRAVKKFTEDEMISKVGNKLVVSEEQYGRLKQMVQTVMDT